jgi:hypothetical protein
MNQKNETPTPGKTKPEAETPPVPAKTGKTSTTNAEAGSGASSPAKPEKSDTAGLSSEVVDLVTELRDTIKSLNPRRHTPKTLRRSLSMVSAILADIEKLLPPG